MGAAKDRRFAPPWPAAVAGLQAGIVGALSLLAWMGLSAAWQRRTFWTAANLMASTFFGPSAIRGGFSWPTVSGLALYVIIYGALGALFGAAVRDRLPLRSTVLAGIAFGMAWYYVSFHLLWNSVNPLVPLLYAERPTIFGHLIYGAVLGRVPRYCRELRAGVPAMSVPAAPPEQPRGAGEPL